MLCRLYYTKEDRVEEAADMVEDAFRISAQKPDERELDPGSRRRLMGRFTGLLGLAVILGVAWLFSTHKRAIKLRIIAVGHGPAVRFRAAGAEDRFRHDLSSDRRRRERHAGLRRSGQPVSLRHRWARRPDPTA